MFRRVLYIYTCMRRWGIEREKKEKLSRTGSKSWRGRQTRCNLIETFIRSPSYIKHRPLKMRWRDNLIWAGLIDRPIPKDARGKKAWRERKNGETKRGVEEREWKFSLPRIRTSFSPSLSLPLKGEGRGEIWERSVLEEAWNDRFPYETRPQRNNFRKRSGTGCSTLFENRLPSFSLFSFSRCSSRSTVFPEWAQLRCWDFWCTGRLLTFPGRNCARDWEVKRQSRNRFSG